MCQTTKVLKCRIKRLSSLTLSEGELISCLSRFVSEVSDEDDRLLVLPRLSALEGERDSLALKTAGYQWYQCNKTGTDKILRINPKNRYTVSESTGLGKVTTGCPFPRGSGDLIHRKCSNLTGNFALYPGLEVKIFTL